MAVGSYIFCNVIYFFQKCHILHVHKHYSLILICISHFICAEHWVVNCFSFHHINYMPSTFFPLRAAGMSSNHDCCCVGSIFAYIFRHYCWCLCRRCCYFFPFTKPFASSFVHLCWWTYCDQNFRFVEAGSEDS